MGCFYKHLHLKFHAPIYNKVFCGFIGGDYSIKIIGVGFALLVQLYRAMRRPLDVERATSRISTLSFCSEVSLDSVFINNKYILNDRTNGNEIKLFCKRLNFQISI